MRRAVGAALAASLLAAGAGCQQGEQPRGPKTLVVLAGADVDSVDPGVSGLAAVGNLLGNVHRALYALRPGEGLVPQPDLAEGPPQVADEGRTVRFRLRRGVRFAPPVRRAVVADDLEYGLERLLLPSVRNPYAPELLSDVVGVDKAVAGRRGDIAGIEAIDDRTLELRFTRPGARELSAALLFPFGVPVPREHAERFDRGKRSTYDRHQVATGPYRLEADVRGRVTRRGWTPGRGVRLVRNPSWDPATDDRPAHVDVVEYRVGNDDAASTVERVLAGRGAVTSAVLTPPSAVRGLDADGIAARFFRPAPDALVLLALNTRRGPFTDPEMRRAVSAAIDRGAIARGLGGAAFARPAPHLIPPAVLGHAESAAVRPRGAGEPEGGDRAVRLVVPARFGRLGEVVQGELERLGFRASVRRVADAALLGQCADPRNAPDACLFGIVYGIYDAGPILQLLAASRSPANLAFLRSPAIDAALERGQRADGAARAAAWAAVNEQAVAEAGLVPLAWPTRPIPHSPDVLPRGVSDVDYAYTDLR